MGFDLIYADPAWAYRVWSKDTGSGRSAESHYKTTSLEDMKALPVGDLANRDCALFMWATMPNLPEAFELGKAWGFKYSTCAFVWVKLNKHWTTQLGQMIGNGIGQYVPLNLELLTFFGMGYWSRANAELCLLFTKGHPKRNKRNVRQVIMEPIGEHSEKPVRMYNLMRQLVQSESCIELFARTTYPHRDWTSLGNEIDGLDLADSIPALVAAMKEGAA